MKSFLTIIGVLAFLGGLLAFIAAASAVHQIFGAIGIMTGCTALGLSKLIELLADHIDRTSAQRQREIAYWERAQPATAVSLPPLPGTENWHVEVQGQIQGPLGHHEIRALRDKRVIDGEAFVFREGWTQWLRLRETKELG